MVDILLAVYNGEKYLKEQIDSIISQTYKDWQIIISDDCSIDGTKSIIMEYKNKFPDKIKYYSNEKNSKSPMANFSKLLELSESPYVMMCDHDDVWLENKIELTLSVMKNLEGENSNLPILVHTDLKVVDCNLNVLSDSMMKSQKLNPKARSLKEIIVQNNVTGCTLMANRKLVEMSQNIPKCAIMHDWWMALVASAFGEIRFLDIPTILYRQHESNQVGSKNARKVSFILSKMFDKKEIKRSIFATYDQARAFLDRFYNELSNDQKKLIEDYLSVGKGNKVSRLIKLINFGFLKYGFVRKLGQIIYI